MVSKKNRIDKLEADVLYLKGRLEEAVKRLRSLEEGIEVLGVTMVRRDGVFIKTYCPYDHWLRAEPLDKTHKLVYESISGRTEVWEEVDGK